MLQDIVEVKPLGGYRLFLRFEDGTKGEIDVAELIRLEGVFSPLKDYAEFQKVHVNADTGTICWPNGADLDADVLYSHVTGKPIPEFKVESLQC